MDNKQTGLSGIITIKKPDGTVINLQLQSKPEKEKKNAAISTRRNDT